MNSPAMLYLALACNKNGSLPVTRLLSEIFHEVFRGLSQVTQDLMRTFADAAIVVPNGINGEVLVNGSPGVPESLSVFHEPKQIVPANT